MKRRKAVLNITYIALGAVLLSVCALIQIPFVVPFTLQTFALALILLLFGGKRGCGSIILYLSLGMIGLPVFSGFNSGVSALVGPTGGYLLGFLLAGGLYLALESIFKDNPAVNLASVIIGFLLCYLCGTAWFVIYSPNAYGLGYALISCVLPYLIPDAIKLAIAYIISKRLKPLISSSR